MHLYPHILFRTDAAASPAATTLRCAGYVVTKVRSDAAAECLVAAEHVDALVVDLGLARAIQVARHRVLREVPTLFLTSAPESLRNYAGDVATLHPREAEDDLVTTVDLLIASSARQGENSGAAR